MAGSFITLSSQIPYLPFPYLWSFRIVLMGGNYVFKAQPYFPPVEVVRSNAKSMAEGWWIRRRDSSWRDSLDGKK